MGFIITKIYFDKLDDFEKNLLAKHQCVKNDKYKFNFKLFDDDSILYVEGFSTIKNSFEPLDDFGRLYGCTEIHYLNNKKFEEL